MFVNGRQRASQGQCRPISGVTRARRRAERSIRRAEQAGQGEQAAQEGQAGWAGQGRQGRAGRAGKAGRAVYLELEVERRSAKSLLQNRDPLQQVADLTTLAAVQIVELCDDQDQQTVRHPQFGVLHVLLQCRLQTDPRLAQHAASGRCATRLLHAPATCSTQRSAQRSSRSLPRRSPPGTRRRGIARSARPASALSGTGRCTSTRPTPKL